MATQYYLDKTGLAAVWGKVKNQITTSLTDYVTKTELDEFKATLSAVYKAKGSVANEAALPAQDNAEGDVYNCIDTGMNYVWTGTEWDALGSTVDLSEYVTTTAADEKYLSKADAEATYMKTTDLVAITDAEIDEICG